MILIVRYCLIWEQVNHLCPLLDSLPKFVSRVKNILVGNGQHVVVLFVILVMVSLLGHRFKVYTLVSEICDNVDMVMGIKICIKWKEESVLGICV